MPDDSHNSNSLDPDATGEFDSESTGEFIPTDNANRAASPELDATLDTGQSGQSHQPDAKSSSGSLPFAAGSGQQGKSSQFGDYSLESEIARGGMGVVFRANQTSLNRPVALKMILAGQLASEDEVRRFYAEAEAAAKLDHPNIVPIYEVGQHADTHFFSMKLIEGSDLSKQLPKLRDDLKKAVALLEQVCRGVAHAHQRGVLHRDLKPANILLDEDEIPFITDLGLARNVGVESNITRTGAIVGTPSYMSPEQAAGNSDLTTATDIYSLGAILYEILTGRPPFRGKTPMDTLMQVIHETPERPSSTGSTDRNLEMVALKCLSKDPTERYQSAAELAEDLSRWIRGEPIAIRSPSVSTVIRTWMHQNFGRAVWILVVGIAGGLVSGFGIWNATVQREIVGNARYVYETLPSATSPTYLFDWVTPSWLVLPSLLLFVGSLSLLGFFTAMLVRTKNSSADIAAGLAVGTISAAAAFFLAFASMSISVSTDRNDLNLLGQLANAPLGETPLAVLDAYPEMENMGRDEQIQLFKLKLDVDRTLAVPRGLGLGTMACLLLFVGAGVAETVIAGRALRRQSTWWRALGEYLFCALPYVSVSTFFGIHIAVLLIFGGSGLILDWFGLLPFAVLGLAVWAETRKWNLIWRIPSTSGCLCMILIWLGTDFSLLPQIAGSRRDLRETVQQAEEFPSNGRLKVAAANAYMTLGIAPFHDGRYQFALDCFQQSINYIDQVPDAERNYTLLGVHGVGYTNSATALRKLGRKQEAKDLLFAALKKEPDNPQMYQRVVDFFLEQGLIDDARSVLESIELTNRTSWTSLLKVAYSIAMWENRESGPGGSKDWEGGKRAAQEMVRRHLSEHASPELQRQLSEVKLLREWQIRLVHDVEKPDELEKQLIEGRFDWIAGEASVAFNIGSGTGDVDRRNESPRSIVAYSPQPVDLASLYPDAGMHRSAYAVTEVICDEAQSARIALGSDDGFEIWLNGIRLGGHTQSRQFAERENEFDVELKQGRNRILLRINQNSGPWMFDLQIDTKDGWPLQESPLGLE